MRSRRCNYESVYCRSNSPDMLFAQAPCVLEGVYKLELSETTLTPGAWAAVAPFTCSSLQELVIYMVDLSNESALAAATALPVLKLLDMTRLLSTTGAAVAALIRGAPQLTDIRIGECSSATPVCALHHTAVLATNVTYAFLLPPFTKVVLPFANQPPTHSTL